jgi:hypothetical protein
MKDQSSHPLISPVNELHKSRSWELLCLLGGFVITVIAATILVGISLPNAPVSGSNPSWLPPVAVGVGAIGGAIALVVGVCRLTSPAAASRSSIQHSGVFLPWTRGAAVFAWLVTTGLLLFGLSVLFYNPHALTPALILLIVGAAFLAVCLYIMVRDLHRPWTPERQIRPAPLDRHRF